MIHYVSTEQLPEAAEPLAALYVGSRERPVSGLACRGARKRLAEIVADDELAALLRSNGPIEVRPERAQSWAVVDKSESIPAPDKLLVRVIQAERGRQGLSVVELARRAGLNQQTAHRILTEEHGTGFLNAYLLVTRGLGKSLTWLDEQFKQGE